jgi:HlyD family secretion protein
MNRLAGAFTGFGDTFIRAVRSLRLWQVTALAIVFLGSAGATYGAYYQSNNGTQTELSEDEQVLPVRMGDLVNQVSTSGTLTFPLRESLSFGAEGTAAMLLVEENQRVTAGQELARLDPVTVVGLEETIARTSLELSTARESLDDLKEEATAVELAQAREKVADAEFQLQQAVEKLEETKEPYTEQDFKLQEERVATARYDLREAETALTGLTPELARAWVDAVQARHKADKDLEDTQKALVALDRDFTLVSAQAANDLLDAQRALDDARDALLQYKTRGGVRLSILRLDKAAAQDDLQKSEDDLQDLIQAKAEGGYGLDFHIKRVERIVELKRHFLENLRVDVVEVEQLEARVELAEEELEHARTRLAELGQWPDPLERLNLEAKAQVAAADLADADELLADLNAGLDALEVDLKEAQIESARATLGQAEVDLADMLEAPDLLELALLKSRVALAQATLDDARQDLEDLAEPPDPLELALREAEIVSIQWDLEEAMRLVGKTTIRSPIDGLISQVNVEEGDTVKPQQAIFEVVSLSVMEVEGIVDEVDVLSVQVGVRAEVTLDALPGETLEGRVTEIAPSAQNQQGVVSYPIRIQVEPPPGVGPLEGLSAVANIILREERDVLMVPEQGLYGSFDAPVVRVMTPLGVEERPVTLGQSDGFWVSVRQGLSEGDKIVIKNAEISTGGFSFRQFRATTGGGFRGRGGSSGGTRR